jgi:glycerol-3-phosphate dehydrogenase subunit B
MTTHVDVLVVGGGVAGAVAAMAACRRGARVLLCHAHASHSGMSAGPVAVAGAQPGQGGSAQGSAVDARVAELARRWPWHPYARIGEAGRARLPQALALLGELSGDVELCAGPDTDRPLLLADLEGRVQQAELAPRAQVRGDLSRMGGQRWGLIDFAGLSVHDGRSATALLRQADLGGPEVGRPQLFPLGVDFFRRARDQQLSALAAAALLDDEVAVDALARAVASGLRTGAELDGLLVPPVIGLRAHRVMLFRLQALAGLPVVELAGGLPSVPGHRLLRSLELSLRAAGVEVCQQSVVRLQLGDPEVVHAVFAPASGLASARCRRVVLATGSWSAGLGRGRGESVEPLTGAPLFVDGKRLVASRMGEFVHARSRAQSPLWRTGVLIDEALHPLDAGGQRPLHRGLHAAGALLAGNDRHLHGAGLGLCALTGLLAGEAATG